MDISPSCEEFFHPEKNSRTCGIRKQACFSQRSGKGPPNFVPGKTLQRPQKGFGREENHPRCFSAQHFHPLPHLQDDYGCAGLRNRTNAGIHGFTRPQGCLHACPDREVPEKISGFPIRRRELYVPGPSVRPEYSSSDFHKAGKCCSKPAKRGRHPVTPVPRRLFDLGRDTRSMHHSERPRYVSLYSQGVHSELDKVPPTSSAVFRMARASMEHSRSYLEPPVSQSVEHSDETDISSESNTDLETSSGEDCRPTKFCLSSQPTSECLYEAAQSVSPFLRSPFSEGQAVFSSDSSEEETANAGLIPDPGVSDSDAERQRDPHDGHRCVPTRLGCPHGRQNDSRTMASEVSIIPHQCLRTDCCAVGSETLPSSNERLHQSALRQHVDSQVHQEVRICGIESSERMDVGDSHSLPRTPVVLDSHSHCRQGQRPRRRPLPRLADRDRVVAGPSHLQQDSVIETCTRDRPLCHRTKSSTSTIRVAYSRSKCSRQGCSFARLEYLADNLPLSSNEHHGESSSEARRFQRNGISGRSALAEQTVVSSPPTIVETMYSSRNYPHSAGRRQEILRLIKSEPTPSRVDILLKILSNDYSEESARDIVNHLRLSSQRQYNMAWKSWADYVRTKDFEEISEETVLSFLRFLFHEKNLAVNTILTYKAALKLPLRFAFDIDTNTEVFAMITKAFSLSRPVLPPLRPTWSVNKVLDLLSSEVYNSPEDLLAFTKKVMFLISLAIGSRISELCALKRGDMLKFLPNGDLELIPDPMVLAKNEDPMVRRTPIRISKLPDADSSLCPVANLKLYIERTGSHDTHLLFVHPKDKRVWFPAEARKLVCTVIREANPGALPKAHDIRKMASSLAFFSSMSFKSIREFTGWSSPSVFIKHYLSPIEDLQRSCVVLGDQAGPAGPWPKLRTSPSACLGTRAPSVNLCSIG